MGVTAEEVEPRRRPSQGRSRALVDAILGAAARLLENAPADGLSVARIARRAGVSVGSLYQYFTGKESVLAALIERRIRADVEETIAQVSRGDASLLALMRGSISQIVEMHRRDRNLYSRLLPLVPLLGRTATARAAIAEARDVFRGILAERYASELRPDDLDLAVFMCGTAIEAIVHRAIEERPELLDDPRFAEEITQMMHRYMAR